ncbi:MAG: hypothetical protein QJR03_01335 [Sphaerobacter sp.]|nr:hypothetical protein [Sphaerobacter sp.]
MDRPKAGAGDQARPPGAVWRPFVVAAIALALTGGFAAGGALLAARWLGVTPGRWWVAAGQVHGQVQMLGWVGLMVLGVALHFLPRLVGAPLRGARLAPVALGLIVAGLVLRALCQPLVAAERGGAWPRGGLLAAAGITLGGVTLAVGMLLATLVGPPPPRKRGAVRSVLPLFPVAFGSLWGASALSAWGLLDAARGLGVVAPARDRAIVQLELYAFLLPVAAAMTARTFPLYFQTHLARTRLVTLGVAGILGGLALQVPGDLALAGLGRVLRGAALVVLIVALRVWGERRPLPRRPVHWLRDPLQLLVLSAYAWLAVAAGMSGLTGLRQLGVGVPAIPPDSEWHAVGAGFATLLIFGVGAHMIPGFAQRRLRRAALAWATLVLGNLAALLRVGTSVTGRDVAALGAVAGVAGLVAVGLFAVNLTGPPRAGPAPRRYCPNGQ